MHDYDEQYSLGRHFHTALAAADWDALRALVHDDATWVLPGDNTISGTAEGGDAVIDRAKKIAGYGLTFELQHILVSRENMALSLHNTARRGDTVLDEYLATVCFLRDGKVARIETYLSDVQAMNAFFV
ncbi:nuclear transport factor 2 family protein [Streptomyces sp. NPDC055952]|uniref:nuclear transport factor 2 family protein n=1 Tax=Streptomyces sp. NPDC055952 TaxID=3345663 RepID=UPI0035DD7CA6